MNRVGGIIRFTVDGAEVRAKGGFTYNLGLNKRETITGTGKVAGYKEMPQPAFIEGALTDTIDFDMKALILTDGATVILELANGKSVVLRDAYFVGEGEGTTEEGEVKIRFESISQAELIS